MMPKITEIARKAAHVKSTVVVMGALLKRRCRHENFCTQDNMTCPEQLRKKRNAPYPEFYVWLCLMSVKGCGCFIISRGLFPGGGMAADDGFSFDVFLFRRAEGVGFNGPELGLSAKWRPDMNGARGRVVRAAAKRGSEKYLQLSWSLWPGSLLLRHMFL